VPYPSPLEIEIATAKCNNYTSPSSDQIPAELIQPGSETLLPEIRKPIPLFGISS
jgi:hypothetical protein